jgi:hypothetical protein
MIDLSDRRDLSWTGVGEVDDEGLRTGTWTFALGEEEHCLLTYVRGRLQGPYRYAHREGHVEDGTYLEGLKNGLTSYHRGEELVGSEEWEGGVLHGMLRTYQSPDTYRESEFENGILHGSAAVIVNGIRVRSWTNVNGVFDGPYERVFVEEGQRLLGHFIAGKEDGEWVYSREDGTVLGKQVWRGGVLVSQEANPDIEWPDDNPDESAR